MMQAQCTPLKVQAPKHCGSRMCTRQPPASELRRRPRTATSPSRRPRVFTGAPTQWHLLFDEPCARRSSWRRPRRTCPCQRRRCVQSHTVNRHGDSQGIAVDRLRPAIRLEERPTGRPTGRRDGALPYPSGEHTIMSSTGPTMAPEARGAPHPPFALGARAETLVPDSGRPLRWERLVATP